MSVPFDCEHVAHEIREIVKESNLESCTVKEIIEHLEGRLECSFKEHLDKIKDIVDNILIERLTADEDARLARQLYEEELKSTRRRAVRAKIPPTKPAPRGTKVAASGFNRPLILSTALSDLLDGVQLLPRPTVVKKIWEYVRRHNLQDPKNKRVFICDEKLEAVFKRKRVDCFKMNRILTSHLHTQEEVMKIEKVPPTIVGSRHDPELFESLPLPPKDQLVDLSKLCVPAGLKHLAPSLEYPISFLKIQEACYKYLQVNSLIDPQNPTSIKVDEKIRTALNLSSETTITLFDYLDRIRGMCKSLNS